jgi:hypothetical protein
VSDPIPRVGALARWHAEMRRGARGNPDNYGTWKYDDLWSAACAEKCALEMEAEGDGDRARYWMDSALLRLNGHSEPPDTKEGRKLLAELRAKAPSAPSKPADDPVRAPIVARRRRELMAGLGPLP